MREKKIILGTVQLGLDYGINNQSGKPSKEDAFDILDTAIKNHVEYLDTAAAYGDSETIIGDFQKQYEKKFKVCTKLILEQDCEEGILEIVNRTIDRLAVSEIEILYLHRFEQAKNRLIMEKLLQAKAEHKINKIGISIYEPSELEFILMNLSDIVDVVQIPYNILDYERWNALIKQSHNHKIEIYARSVFLQGLLFKEENDAVIQKLQAEKYVKFIKKFAGEKNVSAAKLLLDYCRKSEVDAILIGCESKKQLLDNLALMNQENCLKNEEIAFINDKNKEINPKIIDPRRW